MEYKFTDLNFEEEVLNCDLPVLVDFYADWCGPCKMMAPIIEEMAAKYDGKIKIGKCNVDENETMARKYRIMSIPAMKFFSKGEVVDTIIGAVSENELEDMIKKTIG